MDFSSHFDNGGAQYAMVSIWVLPVKGETGSFINIGHSVSATTLNLVKI
jgi:hypothetical protein